MPRRRFTLWASALVIACGGGGEPPPSKSPAAVTVVSEEPDVAPEPMPVTVVDLVGRDADIFVYFDAKVFRQGTLYAAIMNVVNSVPVARDELSKATQSCGFNPVEVVSEVAFSGRARGRNLDMDSAVLVARSSESPKAVVDCVAQLLPELERGEVDGHPALITPGPYVVAVDTYLVIGTPRSVRRVIDRMSSGAGERVPRGFLYSELEAPELFDAQRIVVGAGHGSKGTELEVHVRATSVEQAQEFERSVIELRREGLEELQKADVEPATKNLVTELVERVEFERRGADLQGSFDFGSPEREAQILGVGTAMVVHAIDRYLHKKKVYEARGALRSIAYSLRDYAMSQKPPRFPASAPLVPQQVPAASSYQSAEADWQQPGWKEIGFAWARPQHYAVGFESTRGGRKVTIRALGDLDGDGQQARFEMDLEIQRDEVIGDFEIREHDPDE